MGKDCKTGGKLSDIEFFKTFGKIGLLSFGGPAGQIALMHLVLVDEKKWLEEKQFLHALNFCMLLPGPEAMQLATYAGWRLKGVWGGIVAGSLFVLPGFFVILALSIFYVLAADMPLVAGLLFGLKASVLAIVIQALYKVSKRALIGISSYLVAMAALIMLAVLQLPFPVVILAAGLIGFLLPGHFSRMSEVVAVEPVKNPVQQVMKVLVWAVLLWAMPLLLLMATLGREHVYTQEALFFSKTAIVTFGGAYAVLQYVGQQAVEAYQWLKPDEMVTGLGLAETTPGPLILVLEFVGFVGAYRNHGILSPMLSGLFGAVITVWFTFLPCFIWIFLGAPFMEQLRANRRLSGALAAITSAVVGVIANLSLWFGIHVLFAATHKYGAIDLPVLSSLNLVALTIAVAAGVMIWRGAGLFAVLGFAVIAGIAARLAGLA